MTEGMELGKGIELDVVMELDEGICRYRQLADSAARQAAEGNYSSSDEALMMTKAKAIVECFLDSDIVPRVQVTSSFYQSLGSEILFVISEFRDML